MKRTNPRTDIASRKPFPKEELLRLVCVAGTVTVDKAGNMPGRGYYLHKDVASLEVALRKHVFERLFHRTLTDGEIASIKEAL